MILKAKRFPTKLKYIACNINEYFLYNLTLCIVLYKYVNITTNISLEDNNNTVIILFVSKFVLLLLLGKWKEWNLLFFVLDHITFMLHRFVLLSGTQKQYLRKKYTNNNNNVAFKVFFLFHFYKKFTLIRKRRNNIQ